MLLWCLYLCYLYSNIVDLVNVGLCMVGLVIVVLYLEWFIVDGQKWVYLDVYVWNDGECLGCLVGGEVLVLCLVWVMFKVCYV